MQVPQIPPDVRYLRGGRVYESSGGAVGGGDNTVDGGYSVYYLDRIAQGIDRLASLRVVTQGIISRVVTVTSTPTLLIHATRDRAYTIINPTAAVGLTTTGSIVSNQALTTAGNSQATPLGVANYDALHVFLNVASAAGLTLHVYSQVRNPVNNVWIDVQDLLPAGITTDGDYYFNLGNFGVATQFAVRWEITGTCNLSVMYALKEGLGGSSSGTANTVYIGNSGVTLQAGYPILEGQFRDFYLAENAELWGVSQNSVGINIIELS